MLLEYLADVLEMPQLRIDLHQFLRISVLLVFSSQGLNSSAPSVDDAGRNVQMGGF